METTVNIEFTSDTKEHLKILEDRLKHIADVKVDLIEPREMTAPALVAIEIKKSGERGEVAGQHVAQILHDFLHENEQGQKKIFLVTIEGERIDIEPLSVAEIGNIIVAAEEGER